MSSRNIIICFLTIGIFSPTAFAQEAKAQSLDSSTGFHIALGYGFGGMYKTIKNKTFSGEIYSIAIGMGRIAYQEGGKESIVPQIDDYSLEFAYSQMSKKIDRKDFKFTNQYLEGVHRFSLPYLNCAHGKVRFYGGVGLSVLYMHLENRSLPYLPKNDHTSLFGLKLVSGMEIGSPRHMLIIEAWYRLYVNHFSESNRFMSSSDYNNGFFVFGYKFRRF